MRINLDAKDAFRIWIKALAAPLESRPIDQPPLSISANTAIDFFILSHPKHIARHIELRRVFAEQRFVLDLCHWNKITQCTQAGFGLEPKSGRDPAGRFKAFNVTSFDQE